MQVSALNLIIAAQQARGTTASPPASGAKAAEAPKTAAPETAPDFAPLAFRPQAGAVQAPASTAAPAAYSANAPLGSQIDIRI